MKVEICISLFAEKHIDTRFKTTLINFTKSNILTKISVFLPVDWDDNSLLFTKWFHITNEITGH